MTEKINGYGRTELPSSASRSGGVKGATQSESARSTSNAASEDAVALTDTAVRLKRIESNLAELPDIDQVKIDTLRERVEAGEYAINSNDVARRLLQMDQDLA